MTYLPLNQLNAYKLSCVYSEEVWIIYQSLDWRLKKLIGDQTVRSTDSVGANIAEGYGRYHYLDKIKFYYNARGSLFESKHWLDKMYKRKYITKEEYLKLGKIYKNIQINLNCLISSIYRTKNKD